MNIPLRKCDNIIGMYQSRTEGTFFALSCTRSKRVAYPAVERMSLKLRDLIRNVRACKTAAEERAVIAKECAEIRTAFKSKDDDLRHRHVAKLLYIHMLGYPTYFGQMEAMKLVASNRFGEKRIGYLALMILLDEDQELLMMATNSMKKDMTNKNPFIVGLALCAIGNISSADIARDLSRDVAGFFSNPNPYLRKKAALTAIRIIRKVPDSVDEFIPLAPTLLTDRNHAVQLTGLQLMLELTKIAPECIPEYRTYVPKLVSQLKTVWLAGYMSEYDVMGITDPFLQTAIIRLLRVLGEGDAAASEHMNEILAQVVINTDASKVPGAAILYECVQTIMTIEAEGGLRVLAINVLGKFLQSKDNNIRYVALNTLCKVVHRDADAIQRHRNTVVDCLKDIDISIRRRALNLIYALVTKNNVRALVKELLNYLALTNGGSEFKSDLVDKICNVVERYAPTRVWHISTMVQTLCIAGNVAREDVAVDLVALIARSKDLHAFAVHELFTQLNHVDHMTQQPLAQVALWTIGEFGDQLVSAEASARATTMAVEGESSNGAASSFHVLAREDVLALVGAVMMHRDTTEATQQAALSCLAKLAQRFAGDATALARIRELLAIHARSSHIELQQRSCEYDVLVGVDAGLRAKILAKMPTFTRVKGVKLEDEDVDVSPVAEATPTAAPTPAPAPAAAPAAAPATAALDLLSDMFNTPAAPAPASTNVFDIFAATSAPTAPAAVSAGGVTDIMDMFGMPAAQPQAAQAQAPVNVFDNMGFGAPAAAPATAGIASFPDETIFDANGLKIVFSFTRPMASPEVLTITAKYTNSNAADITNFDFQVAVPPHIKRELRPATSKTLPAFNAGAVTQVMVLTNTAYGQKKTLMKARVVYSINGENKAEQLAISQFPN